jgi:hypothetical protein
MFAPLTLAATLWSAGCTHDETLPPRNTNVHKGKQLLDLPSPRGWGSGEPNLTDDVQPDFSISKQVKAMERYRADVQRKETERENAARAKK